MKLVPPRENRSPVGIGFALHNGVMNTVHSRRHNDVIQNPFEPDGQSPIRMMKQCRAFKRDEKNQQHDWPCAEDDNGSRKKTGRENHLAKVKTRRSAHIHVEIGVMNIMKSPE